MDEIQEIVDKIPNTTIKDEIENRIEGVDEDIKEIPDDEFNGEQDIVSDDESTTVASRESYRENESLMPDEIGDITIMDDNKGDRVVEELVKSVQNMQLLDQVDKDVEMDKLATKVSNVKVKNYITLNKGIYDISEYPDTLKSVYHIPEFFKFKADAFYKDYQVVIQRFLASCTPYYGILLFHGMGTGKTCTVTGLIESIKQYNYRSVNNTPLESTRYPHYTGAIIVTKNDVLIDEFKKMIVTVCARSEYYDENYERHKQIDKLNMFYKKTLTFYKFCTYDQFSKFNAIDVVNKIICLDEVHTLYNSGKKEYQDYSDLSPENRYEDVHSLLHRAKNSKIVLMTGTPMRNEISDIAYIMNLILPMNEQLPTRITEFESKFTNLKDLIPYLEGRVFYRQLIFKSSYEFVGSILPIFDKLRLFTTKISPFQERRYNYLLKKDISSRFGSSLSQSTLFVFPDGTSGSEGYEKNIEQFNETRYRALIKEKLNHYSSKYDYIISKLLEKPKEKAFVYIKFVYGSGCLLFAKLLEIFGYKKAMGIEGVKGRRYALITGLKDENNAKLIDLFNSEKNVYGDYIQVFIGSDKISEGITLKDVLHTHIVTPKWNYGAISQIICRTHRINSHSTLEKLGIPYMSRIYQHTILLSKENTVDNNIDIKMYKICEDKDIKIKEIERIIKKISVDCILNRKEILTSSLEDYSRECDYKRCKYKCIPCGTKEAEDLDLNTSPTYFKFYYDDTNLKQRIFGLLFDNVENRVYNVDLISVISELHNEYLTQTIIHVFDSIENQTVLYGDKSYQIFNTKDGIITINNIYDFTTTGDKPVIVNKSVGEVYVKKIDVKGIDDDTYKIVTNPKGYYGIMKQDIFKIAKSIESHKVNTKDKRSISTGRNSKTIHLVELIKIAHDLHIPPPSTGKLSESTRKEFISRYPDIDIHDDSFRWNKKTIISTIHALLLGLELIVFV